MPNPKSPRSWLWELTVVLELCTLAVLFSLDAWLKMTSFWGDGPRWLFESYRVFLGAIPYRDLAALYPPLSLYVFSIAYEWFGPTFTTAQVVLDLLSLGAILSIYALARQFLPRLTSAALAVTVMIAGATTETAFKLFSLDVYTPSVLLSAMGLNLFLAVLIGALRAAAVTGRRAILLALGSGVCVASRIETIVPVGACLALAALVLWPANRHARFRVMALAAAILAPGLAFLGWFAVLAGSGQVIEGTLNYGSAKGVCPYWPTGLGALGFVAGLGQAYLVYLPFAYLGGLTRARPVRTLLVALSSAAVVAMFVALAWNDLPRYWALAPEYAGGESYTLAQRLSSVVALTHLLVPVMAVTVIHSAGLAARVAAAIGRNQPPAQVITAHAILYTAAAALCVRSMFGGLWTEIPTVTPVAYPVLFVAAGVLLARAWTPHSDGEAAKGRTWYRTPNHAVTAVFLLFAAARLLWTYGLKPPPAYIPLETEAGPVRVLETSSADVYRYVAEHSESGDLIADFGFGGGVNFAARRNSPLFMTMFSMVRPSEDILRLDENNMRRNRPLLVLGNRDVWLGARYGSMTTTGCMFPAIVWRSSRLLGDPHRVLPAIRYTLDNYTPVFASGSRRVLLRKDRLREAPADGGKMQTHGR